MRYVFAILFVLVATGIDAQKYHKCFVYQYYGNDSGSRSLVLAQTFNDKGKLIHEMANHYINYESIGGKNTSGIRDDGVYDYYFDDTLLKMMTEINFKEHHDSDRHYYYYDSHKKLVKQTMKHHKPDSSELFFDPEQNAWQSLTPSDFTMLYFYDDKGNVIEKDRIANDTSKEYFVFDDQNRLTEDRFITKQSNFESFRVAYQYEGNGYKKYSRFYNHLEFPALSEYELDNEQRIIEERNYFPMREEAAEGKFKQNYKLLSRTVNRYNSMGQIAVRKYYKGDKLTTTHVFVYE